jgi:hypothetical protein
MGMDEHGRVANARRWDAGVTATRQNIDQLASCLHLRKK